MGWGPRCNDGLLVDWAAHGERAFGEAQQGSAEEIDRDTNHGELEGGPVMGERFRGVGVRSVAGMSVGSRGEKHRENGEKAVSFHGDFNGSKDKWNRTQRATRRSGIAKETRRQRHQKGC